MASPVTVGTTAIVVIEVNRRRHSVRFQNVGTTTINMKKIPLTGTVEHVSISDFEVQLFGASTSLAGGDAFETDSTNGFMALSSADGGALSIHETQYI